MWLVTVFGNCVRVQAAAHTLFLVWGPVGHQAQLTKLVGCASSYIQLSVSQLGLCSLVCYLTLSAPDALGHTEKYHLNV